MADLIEIEEWIRLFINTGDEEYFEHIYDAYFDYSYALVAKYNKNAQDVSDILQTGWTKVYFALPKFQSNSSFKTWLSRICLNESYNHKKKHKKELYYQPEFLDFLGKQSYIEKNKIFVTIIMDALSKDDRVLLEMKYIHGYSYAELGIIYNSTQSALKMRINRIKAKIQKQYKN